MFRGILFTAAAAAILCATPVGGESVLEYLAATPKLSKFYKLLMAMDEVKERIESGRGPYTLFVPTNAAYRDFMKPGIVGALEREPELLRKLVAYHVVTATEFLNMYDVPVAYAGLATSLQGRKLILESNAEQVTINSQAKVVQQNVGPSAQNTAIHIVDNVLHYPGWFAEKDILGTLRNNKDARAFFNTVWSVREELGLLEDGPVTVFLPDNKAFARAGLGKSGTNLKDLLEADREKVLRILKYHVAFGSYLSPTDLGVPGMVATLDVQDEKANFLVYSKDISDTINLNNGEAKVEPGSKTTLLCTNGIVHIMDRVIMPPGVEVPDLNYSSSRVKAMKAARRLEWATTPEPPQLPVPDLEATENHPKKSPLAIAVVVLFAAYLIYRVSAPEPATGRSGLVPISPKRAQAHRVDAFLAFALVLLLCVPMFTSMKWVLPPALKWTSTDIMKHVHDSINPPPAPPAPLVVSDDHSAQLDHLLSSMEMRIYKPQLLDYGLDRVDLVARASPADGERVGIKLAHWNRLVHEAQNRARLRAEDYDPTPPPDKELEVRPSLAKTDDQLHAESELEAAKKLAEEFDVNALILGNQEDDGHGAAMSPEAKDDSAAAKPKVVAAPKNDKKNFVVAFLYIPSTGASTVECSFGAKHGNFAIRNAAQLERIKMVHVSSIKEVKDIEASRGKGKHKDVAPDATVLSVMVATRPMNRFIRSFYKSVGKTNTAESDFRCDGLMRNKIREKKFSLEDYSKLPEAARKLCEHVNNPMVKMLNSLPTYATATEDHLEVAKKELNKLDVLMLDEESEKRSMLMLMTKLNLTEGSYVSCSPYEDMAKNEWSLRATDVIARDNNLDRLLFSEVYHVFNTKYAGTFEQSADASKLECTQEPAVCFDENDANGDKKAKDVYEQVQRTIKRSSSRQAVMCATSCQMPKSNLDV